MSFNRQWQPKQRAVVPQLRQAAGTLDASGQSAVGEDERLEKKMQIDNEVENEHY